MQQKITKLGVGESRSFFQTINIEAPNHQRNFLTNSSQKNKTSSNKIPKTDYSNNSNNINSPNNFHEENNKEINDINQLNSDLNNSLDNDNDNNSQFHSGRWTEEEHQKFIDGILQYGNEWKKVQQIIKTRSSTQARSHAQKFFLRVKKIIKNNGGNFNINEKDKIFENIINNILPNKKGESLTQIQKEKLLSAISSNIKYEGESLERSEEELQIGLEEDNLKYKDNNENGTIFKYHKYSNDMRNTNKNNNIFSQRKISIGQKRKLSKIDSRDKIFLIQKDISHKPSLDLSIQNNNKSENNENILQTNINENEINPENKGFECNRKNINSSVNNAGFINNNPFINNEINENKNNLNGCIINNYINVTNNYMNNKYICNFCSNDMNNNNYNYNNYQDFFNYNYDKNDSINNDRNYNYFGFSQCPDKNIYNYPEKPASLGNNQFKQTFYNIFNFNNNKINNYNENENLNNGANPFDINFNNFNNDNYNYNNSESERQISIRDDEFLKLNNNEDNNDYN